MRAILLLTLAVALVGVTALAPTAAADISFGIDWSQDRDCDDAGEQFSVPAPIHRHAPCST